MRLTDANDSTPATLFAASGQMASTKLPTVTLIQPPYYLQYGYLPFSLDVTLRAVKHRKLYEIHQKHD